MNRSLTIINRFNTVNRIIAIPARWSVLAMLGLGFWNVIGRHLGVAIGYNLSSNRLIEGQWYCFGVIFLLGLGWTLQKQSHVRVDVLQSNLSKKRKSQIEIFGTMFLLLPFTIIIFLISIEPAFNSWMIQEASPDPNGLPRYIIRSLIPIGFALLSIQGITELIKHLAMANENKQKPILK